MQKADTLIIGQGLAGTILALQLLDRGDSVRLVDNHHLDSASMAAAGLINPIIGKRLVKHPLTDNWMSSAKTFYQQHEKKFQRPLLFEIPMWRLFKSADDQQQFEKRNLQPHYQNDLGEILGTQQLQAFSKSEFGGFVTPRAGYLDTRNFLEAAKAFFQQQHCIEMDSFSVDKLSITDDGIRYSETCFRRVIFCEGYRAIHNPWFEWLPFQPAKGEIITLKSNSQITKFIINKGEWLIPLNDGDYRFGATYDRKTLDSQTTTEGRDHLFSLLNDYFFNKKELDLVAHRAGVRPNTKDKEPFIGNHPEINNIYIFNGFGSRGSLTIPYYANVFCNHLFDETPLPSEIAIQRHWRKI